jgi:tetratricopeptide (TPR) repeat protein
MTRVRHVSSRKIQSALSGTRAFIRSHKKWLYALGTMVIVVVAIGVANAEVIREQYEILSIRIFPNADRAFSYGEEHFDATNPSQYNINLANYFFWQARDLDPNLLYVDHEIARIYFLRGEYGAALVAINLQIENHGDSTPNSYYIRGLIEGYMGDYGDADIDYKHFIPFDPHDWAAKNDDAWVLLKANRYEDALQITDAGLADDPTNPWLLNSQATALYELGNYKQALSSATMALNAFSTLTDAQWSHAYPGNDPAIAPQGLATFKNAIVENIHTINLALASSTIE